MSHRRAGAAIVAALCLAGLAPAAHADGPGSGTPTIATLGDSYISGEAGRWAGNSNGSSSSIDALGSTAYYDNASNTAETISGCHRSKAAEAFIGGGVNAVNFACSGAKTASANGSSWKPGLDFYDDGAGHVGQAKALQQYAATHNVKLVVALIGANNYGFADIAQSCVVDWYFSPSWWPNYCYDDASVSSRFTASNQATITAQDAGAFQNLRAAMRGAGYADSQWKLLVQTYASPIPPGALFRYSQSGYTRQTTGGCGVWNRDADWANNTAVVAMNNSARNGLAQSGVTNSAVLDFSQLLAGRRLCENTVGLLEERGVSSWTAPGASDKTEWVSQIRTTSTLFGPYQLQEDLHPSYWGQLAERNCVRQAYNGGSPRGGACVHGTGLNTSGEPNTTLG